MKKETTTPLPHRLWTAKEAAAFLGVPVSTMYFWSYRGEGPRLYRVGRSLRYSPDDLRDWLDRQAA